MHHVHLDPIGGVAGDMFAAALLDALPEHGSAALAVARSLLGDQGEARLVSEPVGGFAGARLLVTAREGRARRGLADLRSLFEGCAALGPGATAVASDIATRLADAESAVHGVPIERIHFHEVGAIDSIADIALAGFLIDALGGASWSVGPLPLGGGTVRSAHGVLPLPAPATVRLLEGFEVEDDGLSGERVTPTGAAILAHLRAHMCPRPAAILIASGFGFGTRDLPGRPNALRVLVMRVAADDGIRRERVTELACEIDDQSGEDLAIGLEAIRAVPGVLDVVQLPALGKKGRMAVALRVLCRPERAAAAREALFAHTTTLGLREGTVTRHALRRTEARREGLRVKTAYRPGGATGKAEADDLRARGATRAEREALRRRVEGRVERDDERRGDEGESGAGDAR